jgi:hypothetical protein
MSVSCVLRKWLLRLFQSQPPQQLLVAEAYCKQHCYANQGSGLGLGEPHA